MHLLIMYCDVFRINAGVQFYVYILLEMAFLQPQYISAKAILFL